jgi:tetratricopeptide (TPR) repeat protein
MKYLTIILLFSGYFSYASDSIFSIANSEYDNENYKSAIEKYQEIVSDSLESPELYFNMGNCFYKLEDYASAIFFYEKSLLIQNDFIDAKENIELVKTKLIDKSEMMPKLFYLNWLEKIKNLQDLTSWKKSSIILIAISLLFFLLSLTLKLRLQKIANIFLFISLITFFITFYAVNNLNDKNQAIIFSNSSDVKSAPSENSKNLFTIHLGTKVLLIDKIGNWHNIKLENGSKGWIKDEKLVNGYMTKSLKEIKN